MVMKDLPGSGSMVAILHEVSRNGDRIRKGPAPLNLPVPKYTFLSDTRVKIG